MRLMHSQTLGNKCVQLRLVCASNLIKLIISLAHPFSMNLLYRIFIFRLLILHYARAKKNKLNLSLEKKSIKLLGIFTFFFGTYAICQNMQLLYLISLITLKHVHISFLLLRNLRSLPPHREFIFQWLFHTLYLHIFDDTRKKKKKARTGYIVNFALINAAYAYTHIVYTHATCYMHLASVNSV